MVNQALYDLQPPSIVVWWTRGPDHRWCSWIGYWGEAVDGLVVSMLSLTLSVSITFFLKGLPAFFPWNQDWEMMFAIVCVLSWNWFNWRAAYYSQFVLVQCEKIWPSQAASFTKPNPPSLSWAALAISFHSTYYCCEAKQGAIFTLALVKRPPRRKTSITCDNQITWQSSTSY